MAVKIDATRPLYAVVGAGDLAVELARTAANDVTSRFAKVELGADEVRAVLGRIVEFVRQRARIEQQLRLGDHKPARQPALRAVASNSRTPAYSIFVSRLSRVR